MRVYLLTYRNAVSPCKCIQMVFRTGRNVHNKHIRQILVQQLAVCDFADDSSTGSSIEGTSCVGVRSS
jgi:hypothetical protein